MTDKLPAAPQPDAGLLPCPFCGGEAMRRVDMNRRPLVTQAGCPTCLVWRTPEVWNRRAPSPASLPPERTPTPLTDSALLPTLFNMQTGEPTSIVRADFARSLERRLAAAVGERDELEKNWGRVADLLCGVADPYLKQPEDYVKELQAALAERSQVSVPREPTEEMVRAANNRIAYPRFTNTTGIAGDVCQAILDLLSAAPPKA